MNIIPLGERLIVKEVDAETVSAGGIIIPDTSQEKSAEGEVVAIGSEVRSRILIGNKVLYGKYAGTQIESEGEEYLVLIIDDVIGIVKGA